MNEEPKVKPVSCPQQAKKTRLIEDEFHHTRKRLGRAKIAPLVQFVVFAYNCDDKVHEGVPDTFHIDFASYGSDIQVNGGLQSAIAATEALLAALKAKLQ